MKFLLNTGRTIMQGSHVELKYSDEYQRETSSCRMNPLDILELCIDEGDNVQLISRQGQVVLRTVPDENLPCGIIFVPYGPYANHIMEQNTHSTGMPDFKSVEVEIRPTDKRVKTVSELMRSLGGSPYESQ